MSTHLTSLESAANLLLCPTIHNAATLRQRSRFSFLSNHQPILQVRIRNLSLFETIEARFIFHKSFSEISSGNLTTHNSFHLPVRFFDHAAVQRFHSAIAIHNNSI